MVSEPQIEKDPKDKENNEESATAADSNEPAISLKGEKDGHGNEESTQVRVANGVADIGKRLGQAREVRNYGIKEVASELNLAPSIVSALEVGDMERLPEMTYIRGYLRAYARLLGLSDELDDRINLELRDRGMYEESSASRFIVSDASPLSRARPSGGSGLFKKLFFLLPILVIGTLIWLFTQRGDLVKQYLKLPELPTGLTSSSFGDDESSKEEGAEVEVEAVVEAETVTDGTAVSVPKTIDNESASGTVSSAIGSAADAATDAAESITDTATDAMNNATESVIEGGEDAANSVSQAVQDILVSEESEADTAQANDNQTDETPTEEATPEENASTQDEEASTDNEENTETTAAAVGDARLLISLTNDSWVQVKDGNNKVIAEGMYRAGKTITANGQVPMRITLGNASGASVSFDGAEVDITSFIKGNVARFEVGG